MIIKEYFYNIRCDCCREVINELWYPSQEDAKLEMQGCDRALEISDKHYCPNCWHVNDDDNIETKDGHIFDWDTHEEIKS